MNREELRGLGLTDEQIDSVMSNYGKSIKDLKEKADKLEGMDALNMKIEDYETQLTERDKQLEELKGKANGNQGLLDQINQLKIDNETTTTELQGKLSKQAFDFNLDKELSTVGVRNPKAIKALLNMEDIKLEEGKLTGLESQVTALRKSDDYLFQKPEGKGNTPSFTTPGNPKGTGNETASAFEKASDRITKR